MTHDFFAAKEDHILLLEFIFSDLQLRLFDLYSPPDSEIRAYTSLTDVLAHFDLDNPKENVIHFNIWAPKFGGDVLYRKIVMDPKRVKDYTHRYATNGWGLIQLYLGCTNASGEITMSHIGHFTEQGATAREDTTPDMGLARSWNWKEIARVSRKLKYMIHNKWSVRIENGYDVMPAAALLMRE